MPAAQGWDDLTTDDLRELAYGSLATQYQYTRPSHARVQAEGGMNPADMATAGGVVSCPQAARRGDPAWAGSGPRDGTVLPEVLPYDPEGEHEGLPEEVVRARRERKTDHPADDASGSFSG
jgi:hypothetical protein